MKVVVPEHCLKHPPGKGASDVSLPHAPANCWARRRVVKRCSCVWQGRVPAPPPQPHACLSVLLAVFTSCAILSPLVTVGAFEPLLELPCQPLYPLGFAQKR